MLKAFSITFVSNVEQLYAAVNAIKPATRIILAPGIYTLTDIDPSSVPRPNGGRLELRQHMELGGLTGDRSAVVIDASRLPTSSLQLPAPFNRTAPIRMGLGSNA